MRDLTLIMAYYENPSMLKLQYDWLNKIREDLRACLHFIVVDDGSPKYPAFVPQDLGVKSFQLFRMGVDIPWNQDACRNLAVSKANTRWLLLTDMDHLVPEETLLAVMTSTGLLTTSVYQFERDSLLSLNPFSLSPYKHHPNTWLMTKFMYNTVGGYDERFAGYYSTDGDFRARVKSVAPIERLPQHIIRVPREVVPDASTTTYERRRSSDATAIAAIKTARNKQAPWRPLNGLFPWVQIA